MCSDRSFERSATILGSAKKVHYYFLEYRSGALNPSRLSVLYGIVLTGTVLMTVMNYFF